MYGQPEAEAGPRLGGQQLHLAAMVARYAAHYGEAETGAAGTAIPALIQAHEGLEDLGRQRRIYAGTVVGHLQQIVILLLAHGEGHPAGGVAQGIGTAMYEEIQYDHLLEDESGTDSPPHYPTYALPVINHSPGGYCLGWPSEVPAELQAGEMVGIQDSSNQGWSIAVIRWIRQVRPSLFA